MFFKLKIHGSYVSRIYTKHSAGCLPLEVEVILRQQTRRVMNATENITDAEKQKTVQQLICSAILNTGIHGQSEQLTFISVLNSFFPLRHFLEMFLS